MIIIVMATASEHLSAVNETYFEHQRHALGYGCRLMRASAACLVHALLPSRCVTTASDEVMALAEELRHRRADGGSRQVKATEPTVGA